MYVPVAFVLEDDLEDRTAICETLVGEGYRHRTATSGREFLGLFGSGEPQAVILGLGSPCAEGRDVCRALRALGVAAPIIVVTSSGLLADKLAGFDAGCDDYMTKPFEPRELAARLRALRRLSERPPTESGAYSAFRLDPSLHAAVVGGSSVRLSPTEYRLVAELAANAGKVVRRMELIHSGWPRGAIVHENTLDAYIWRIRRKLAGLSEAPSIETLHGVGYAMQGDEVGRNGAG